MFGSKQFAYCCLAENDKGLGNLISQRLCDQRINNSNQHRATRIVTSNPALKKKRYPEPNNYCPSYEECHLIKITKEAFEKI